MYGNNGRILFINLTSKKIVEENPNIDFYFDYLGGYGVGSRIIFSKTQANIDPLGPDNYLGFTTGTLVGIPGIAASRFTVCTKSPLTNTWGDSNCGGFFGPALKFSGFDALFFSGISPEPVYLWIDNGQAQLMDANWIWGKDSYETEDAICEKHGQDVQVACIGQSGEKLSLISSVMTGKGRAAGRSGVGAVMGSKKLKAIAVKGNIKVKQANPELMTEIRKQLLKDLDTPSVKHFRKYGTIDHVAASAFSNDTPVKNWGGVGVNDFPTAKNISDDNLLKYEVKKYGCWGCPIVCGGIYEVKSGPYAVKEVHKPEYETCGMFGTNLLNDNPESLIKINDLCNRYGIDTISTGSAIGFAIECFENGLLTKEDTGGFELRWADHATIVTLTEQICKREGLGALLGDGTEKAAQLIGKEAETYAVHVGGQELPAHDPRFAPSWGIGYMLDATPGRHTQGATIAYDQGSGIPGLELEEKIERYKYQGKGRMNAKVQNILHALHSAGLCMFATARININYWPKILNAVTGHDFSLDSLEIIGNRIASLRQAFNLRERVDYLAFKGPGRAYGYPPQGKGPLGDISLDMDTMTKEYYQGKGWDSCGRPTRETLEKLGLSNVAKVLYGE